MCVQGMALRGSLRPPRSWSRLQGQTFALSLVAWAMFSSLDSEEKETNAIAEF